MIPIPPEAGNAAATLVLPFHGGCACGAVRYTCSEAPLAMFNCHCRDCQRASGGTFVTVALVRAAALRVLQGAPRAHRSAGDSGRFTDRSFCADCGTPLFATGEVAPGYIAIKPGSLDDARWFMPSIDTWAPRAPAWMRLDPALPKADRTPDVIRGRRAKPPA
ncbi:MAG: GFA family protein [Burkholderiales bacterium]|nr:GFA family protein [Burkholderiales bacterium]